MPVTRRPADVRVHAAHLPLDLAEKIPTSSMPEAALVQGYGVRRVLAAIEPCACGERIVASSRGAEDVALAVRAHNRSTAHQQWRARRQEEA